MESVDYTDPRAIELRRVMDVELTARYTEPGSAGLTDDVIRVLTVDPLTVRATILVNDADSTPIAHAALRIHNEDWEVKRVVVAGDQRGRGVGTALMLELERIALAGGASRLILQTGDRQPEAVSLYLRLGYTPIPVYEPYVTAIPNSLCFEKPLA